MVPCLAHQPLLLKLTFLEKQVKYLSFFKYADSLSLLTFGRSAALKQVLSLPWLDLTPGDAAAELPASLLISWLLCLTQQAEQDEFSPLFITLLQCRLFTFSSFKISLSYWVIQTEVTHCTKPVTSLIYVLVSTSVRFWEIFFFPPFMSFQCRNVNISVVFSVMQQYSNKMSSSPKLRDGLRLQKHLLCHLAMHVMDVTTAITSYPVWISMSHRCSEPFRCFSALLKTHTHTHAHTLKSTSGDTEMWALLLMALLCV